MSNKKEENLEEVKKVKEVSETKTTETKAKTKKASENKVWPGTTATIRKMSLTKAAKGPSRSASTA